MAEKPVQRGKVQKVSREQVYSALRRAGFDKSTAIKMTAVAGTESAYDLGNVRPSTASGTGGNNMLGLFQISDIHSGTSWFKKYGSDWQNIDAQAEMAKAVYDAQGLTRYSWQSYGTPGYYAQLSKASQAAQQVGDNYGKTSGKPSHPAKAGKPSSKPSTKGSTSKPTTPKPKGGTGAPSAGSGAKKPTKQKTFDLFSNPWVIIAIALVLIGLVMK